MFGFGLVIVLSSGNIAQCASMDGSRYLGISAKTDQPRCAGLQIVPCLCIASRVAPGAVSLL